MAAPRVFISSTWYDLKYIRENLDYFVSSLGYDPVLSEQGGVYYDPDLDVQDACLADVPSCQMLVLIIGGRYGTQYRDMQKSVTNAEYDRAVQARIPVFALVEQSVHEEYNVYIANKDNPDVDENSITYPSVADTRIFEFVTKVQTQAANNALIPFSDFGAIRDYLQQQWASMLYRFLTSENEAKRVGDSLSSLAQATEKINFLMEQLVDSVGTHIAKLNVEFYDHMLAYGVVRDLSFWRMRPSPSDILKHDSIEDLCDGQIEVISYSGHDLDDSSITGGGPPYHLNARKLEVMSNEYAQLRKELIERLQEEDRTVEQFLSEA